MDETIAKQITSLVERHNFLVEEINKLDKNQTKKDKNLKNFEHEVRATLELLRRNLDEITSLLESGERYKKIIANEFKQIVKSDSLARLNRRIDNIHFEDNIFREELYSWLNKL